MYDETKSSSITVIPGQAEFLARVKDFLQPFMEQAFLLPRSESELLKLLTYSFMAVRNEDVVGFAAVEIYSKKLAEIQCLAVSQTVRRQGLGKQLVQRCVEVARKQGVKELMAISASDGMFIACGFDYSLPNQKRALFFSPKNTDESADSRD